MAQRAVVLLEDDVDGGEASETLRFAYEGVEYEIDLNQKNAASLRETFAVYASHGRRLGGRQRRGARSPESSGGVDNQAIRAWAASNGVQLKARGRIPARVLDQYRAANE